MWTNGKATSLEITTFIGLRFGTHCELVKKPLSCDQFGIKRLQLMSRGLTSLLLPFLSNASFDFLILVN